MKSPGLLKLKENLSASLKNTKTNQKTNNNNNKNNPSLHRLVIYGRVQFRDQQDDSRGCRVTPRFVPGKTAFCLQRTRVPGDPVWAEAPSRRIHLEMKSEGEPSSRIATGTGSPASRGTISKPTDARTEKGGHGAERIALTLGSLGPQKITKQGTGSGGLWDRR